MNAKFLTPPAPPDEARKTRSDGEQSRERLLQAAMRLFGQHGFSKTSTREIAQAAGANVAAISYYFGDKAGLYQACFAFLCEQPGGMVEAFEQPHFTLREALRGYYFQMLAPLLQHADADVLLRLFYREMLEPTGVWQREIENNIKPEHAALVRVLRRHLSADDIDAGAGAISTAVLDAATDELHRLAYAIPGMCITLLIARDVVGAISPHLIATPAAFAAWGEQLVEFGVALVAAEKRKLQQRTA